MRTIAQAIPAAAAAALLLSAPLGAAEPPAGAPTIEEMLSAVEGPAGGVDAPAGTGPASAPGTREATASRTRSAAPKAPPDVEAEMKAVKARAGHLVSFYQRQKKFYNLADLSMKFDNHKQALRVITDMIRKRILNANRSPVANAYDLADRRHLYYMDYYGDRMGYPHIMYARVVICLGAEGEATKALEEARAKQARQTYPLSSHQRALGSAAEFVAGYAEAKKRLEELETALAEAPTAEIQWEYVTHCSPPANRAVKHLKWLEALLVMLEKYPGHESVTSGLALWQLYHAYRAFAMHDKCAEVLERIAEEHPDIRLQAGPWNARAYGVHWETASAYAEFGLLQEELRDRGALASYRKALELFESFQKTYPKDSRCRPGESGVSVVQTRIGALHTAIPRSAR